MKFINIVEEIESYLDEDIPIYKNPSAVELNKLLRTCGSEVRFTANERTKSFFVFPGSYLHFQATRKIAEFSEIQALMATQEQPSYIFTGTGRIENSKITIIDSDVLKWSKYDPMNRKSVKLRDWGFCDKYLNKPIKDFLKKLKVNK